MSTSASPSRGEKPPLPFRRKLFFCLVFSFALYAAFEGLCALTLPCVLTPKEKSSFAEPYRFSAFQAQFVALILSGARWIVLHPVYGWCLHCTPTEISDQGLRAFHRFGPTPAPGRIRIAAFGDSFTYGQEVGLKDAWTSRLEAIDPRLEVLNFGVSGYGVDQAYLRFHEEAAAYHPRIVVLSLILDDLRRDLNRFRPFLVDDGTDIPLAKPRFVLTNGGLSLETAPLKGADDYRGVLSGKVDVARRAEDDPFNRRGAAGRWYGRLPSYRLIRTLRRRIAERGMKERERRIGALIIQRFVDEARKIDARPVIVLMPDLSSLKIRTFSANDEGVRFMAAVKKTAGADVFDLRPSFNEASGGRALFGKGHFSALGNQVAATAIYHRLSDTGLLSPTPEAPVRENKATRL